MKRFILRVLGEDDLEFGDVDYASFPLPYATQCRTLDELQVGQRIHFGRGEVERVEDEE